MKTLIKVVFGILCVLLLLVSGLVILTWAPDRPVSALQARWAPPPSTFLASNGMNIHLRDEGPREDPLPLVLLHGTSASLHTWDAWVAALKSDHRVVRFDLPGFGLTGPAPDNIYSLDRYTETLMGVLDQLGINRCIIVGNSLGGSIAWYATVQHPTRFEKLVLIDAGGYKYQSISVPIGFRVAKIPLLRDLAERILPRFAIDSSLRNVLGNPDTLSEEQRDRYYELTLREGNRHALAERFRQMPPGTAEQLIPKVQLPTLILWGGKDRLIPPELGERFHRDIAGSELHRFESLGHIPQEEDPAATVSVFKAFL